jgi:hypothetical protein
VWPTPTGTARVLCPTRVAVRHRAACL